MNEWYNNLVKPSWTPPSWVFGVIWPILYILMFISFLLVYLSKKCFPYCNAITLFLLQLFFNIIWTSLFFKLKKPFIALLDLIFIIIFTIYTFFEFKKINIIASLLLIPYILWLFLALSLNFFIVIKN
tara:strand:+ start:88 stop:471 length:384 start_codon:yes stop_codon:yes gene_type:complete